MHILLVKLYTLDLSLYLKLYQIQIQAFLLVLHFSAKVHCNAYLKVLKAVLNL